MSLRLGFHYHVPARAKQGRLLTMGPVGRFIDSLAVRCDNVVCFLHSSTGEDRPPLDYLVRSDNVSFVDIGHHSSLPRRLLSSRFTARVIHDHRREIDALLIRGPTPLLRVVSSSIGELPTALLLVGDFVSLIQHSAQPIWRRELIRLWAMWNKKQQNRVARSTLTFTNSKELLAEQEPSFPHLVEIETSTLWRGEGLHKDDTCQALPCRLLFTGRFSKVKGLTDLGLAVLLLLDQGRDVVLELVGWSEDRDSTFDRLRELFRRRGYANRLLNRGFKPLGPELFAHYASADIFVLPSYHEGFPRAIWEAMAHSTPVVTSDVGSISRLVGNAAMVLPPGDAPALQHAIGRLMDDAGLRRALIVRGRALAQTHTLETLAERLLGEIRMWVGED